MGCLWDFHDWCWDKYSERENADRKNFDEMKTGLNNSLNEIYSTLDQIEDWDSLLEPRDKPEEKITLERKNAIKAKCSISYCCLICYFCECHGWHESHKRHPWPALTNSPRRSGNEP